MILFSPVRWRIFELPFFAIPLLGNVKSFFSYIKGFRKQQPQAYHPSYTMSSTVKGRALSGFQLSRYQIEMMTILYMIYLFLMVKVELTGSYYPEYGKPLHDGIVPDRDLRIDWRFLYIGNKEVDGFYYLGSLKKRIPESAAQIITLNIRRALINAYHERLKNGRILPCPVRLLPNQSLPILHDLEKAAKNMP